MPTSTLHQIAQQVQDLERAITFYQEVLNLPILARFDDANLAFVDLGPVRLALDPKAPTTLLYLTVPDVQVETDRLRASGVTVEREPRTVHVDREGHFGPAGVAEVMSFVRDSEGNLLGLVERRA